MSCRAGSVDELTRLYVNNATWLASSERRTLDDGVELSQNRRQARPYRDDGAARGEAVGAIWNLQRLMDPAVRQKWIVGDQIGYCC